MKRVHLPGFALALVFGATACSEPLSEQPDLAAANARTESLYLVRLRPQTEPAAILHRHGVAAEYRFQRVLHGFTTKLGPGQLKKLREDPDVEAVLEDRPVRGTEIWSLDRIDQRVLPLSGTYARPSTAGAQIHAYVLDTGIRTTHAEFGGRATIDYSTINDGHQATDCHGHGTHIAATIGGVTFGVAPGTRVHGVRILDCNLSGTTFKTFQGLDWVVVNGQRPAIVNLSVEGFYFPEWDSVINRVASAGLVVVAAAGNGATDACAVAPAGVPYVVTVAASHPADRAATEFSNYGPCVDLYAPGWDITSAWRTSDTATMHLTGTSMAAPHVVGMLAALWSKFPGYNFRMIQAYAPVYASQGVLSSVPAGTANRLVYQPFGDNLPPTAQFSWGCEESRCAFTSRSTDDGEIVEHHWTFPNGVTREGNFVRLDLAPGLYEVTLRVKDAEGLTSSITHIVDVEPPPEGP